MTLDAIAITEQHTLCACTRISLDNANIVPFAPAFQCSVDTYRPSSHDENRYPRPRGAFGSRRRLGSRILNFDVNCEGRHGGAVNSVYGITRVLQLVPTTRKDLSLGNWRVAEVFIFQR